jgi:hypothetical protein
MVLVRAENLSPLLCISSKCKVQGDCQWGKAGRREEDGPLKAADIYPTNSAHVFGVLDLWVTVYIAEDSTVLIFLFHCGKREIGCGCCHSVKQKNSCLGFKPINIINCLGNSALTLD